MREGEAALPAHTSSHTSSLSIAGTTIKQDSQGRFCLNDLHRAAGGIDKDKPANWLRLDQARELIEELSNCSEMSNKPLATEAGRYGGTFVVKELVYAYAMWISAKFHLQVIRAYDALIDTSDNGIQMR